MSRAGKLDQLNLTERQKRVCLLYVGRANRSQREVARRLNISRQCVQWHLKAAVRKYPALNPLLFPQRRRTFAA